MHRQKAVPMNAAYLLSVFADVLRAVDRLDAYVSIESYATYRREVINEYLDRMASASEPFDQEAERT